jgi:multidrug efflux pump subunit AcrB
MSLMGVVMLAGIALSNSILIVEFAKRLLTEGKGVRMPSLHPAECACVRF